MQLRFDAIAEAQAGHRWQTLFKTHWPAYRAWYLAHGGASRPALDIAVKRLRRYMPELESTFDQLVALASGDETAARFLSCYRPPPYLISCSQAALRHTDGPLLVRNYDLHPCLNEGSILHSNWNGRRVMASSEMLWGVADGMNDAGLALSLAFGGRKVVGNGFGIPLILRYILEFCERTQEAVEVLQRVPSHMAYNVTVLDQTGNLATVQVGPDRPVAVTRNPQAANHQERIEWAEHSRFTHTLERERVLKQHLAAPHVRPATLLAAFLRPPLYSSNYQQGFGTLYTVLYRPNTGQAEWHWPGTVWRQSFEYFQDGYKSVHYTKDGAKVLPQLTPCNKVLKLIDECTPHGRDKWAAWVRTGDLGLESLMRQTQRCITHKSVAQDDPIFADLLDRISANQLY